MFYILSDEKLQKALYQLDKTFIKSLSGIIQAEYLMSETSNQERVEDIARTFDEIADDLDYINQLLSNKALGA